jgi:YCII-related domain-containing protein
VVTDGPFGESKEAIAGYWFILAQSLDEAVQIAKGNPCLDCGHLLEIRPIDPQPGTPDNTRQSWQPLIGKNYAKADKVFTTYTFVSFHELSL